MLLDLYGGAALTANGKVTARRDTTGASERVNFDAGPSVGIRGGYSWQYVGLSLDVYYFAPDPEATTRTALVEGPMATSAPRSS